VAAKNLHLNRWEPKKRGRNSLQGRKGPKQKTWSVQRHLLTYLFRAELAWWYAAGFSFVGIGILQTMLWSSMLWLEHWIKRSAILHFFCVWKQEERYLTSIRQLGCNNSKSGSIYSLFWRTGMLSQIKKKLCQWLIYLFRCDLAPWCPRPWR